MKKNTPGPTKPAAGKGFQIHRDPVLPTDPEATDAAAPTSTDTDNTARPETLPHTYGRDLIFLTAKDPHTLFLYWDIDVSRHPGGPVLLRAYRSGESDASDGGGEMEQEVAITLEARNWHLRVDHAGATYRVEIGYLRDGKWNPLARSTETETPAADLSSSEEFRFATIPPDVDFETLDRNLADARRPGEALAETLARLDRSGALPAVVIAALHRLLESGNRLPSSMEPLLGRDLMGALSSETLSSQAFLERLRLRLEEHLGSWLSSEALTSRGGESSFAVLSSLFEETFSSAELSSFALSSGALASWARAETSAAPSSLSSWGFLESSWAGGESSWSSWQGAESSWSSPPRGFFMNVNAEVIFYGGTDPGARVTVAGKPIRISKDGTFCFHAVLPDGEDSIPITATSPDGLETREAVLTFRRDTRRRRRVDAAAQPPLPVPPGVQTVP